MSLYPMNMAVDILVCHCFDYVFLLVSKRVSLTFHTILNILIHLKDQNMSSKLYQDQLILSLGALCNSLIATRQKTFKNLY